MVVPRVLLLVLAAAVAGACHEEGDVQVAALTFEGNQAFKDGQLKEVVVTRASGKLPWSRKTFFNRREFDADLERLTAFYADRGYPQARISALDAEFNDDKTAVRLTIRIATMLKSPKLMAMTARSQSY